MEWDRGNGLEAYRQNLMDGLGKGVGLAGEHIMEASNRTVPIEETTLEDSADVTTQGLTATVSYDTPYAVVQHEDLTLRHDAGRSAKFLENAMNNRSQAAAEIIARAARGEL